MNTEKIEQVISLSASELDPNYKTHIYKKLCSENLNKCTQTYGQIQNINPDIEIVDNKISPNGTDVLFRVRYSFSSIQPTIGSEHTGEVISVIDYGIVIRISEHMKAMIEAPQLKGYKFNKGKFLSSKNLPDICTGKRICVRLEKIRSERQTYNCIASLKAVL